MLLEHQIEREQSSHTDLKSRLTSIRQNKTEEEIKQEEEKDSIHSLPESIPESESEQEEEE